ncbi:MAG TPA: biopolymer transporter ExbD [Acidobacteriota bacterium]|nr:biopolymer transporter ExbD [Acidobacteriota bacterium]
MGMTTGGPGGGPKSDINVTPYIDILLVLLIIFMVIQPTTKYDLKARTPQEPEEDLPEDIIIKSDNIVLQIHADGTYAINQEPVTLDAMGGRLFEIYSARSNKNMFVQGDEDLPFGDVIRVIDIAKGSGVGDIGLITSADTSGGGGGSEGGQ